MAFKLVVLLSALAVANAGIIAEPAHLVSAHVPAITSGHQNILRSYGNLGQVSSYSKTIDTPFSSVSKHDVRVSNPGLAVHAAYAAPVAHAAYAAPIAHHYSAPVAHHYSAPVAHAAYAAPVAHAAYAAPVAHAAYAAPVAHVAAAPLAHHAYAAPIAKVAAAPALLGVAYSAAPAVSHMSYSNGLGLTYSW